jgi:hypothetical protein
MWTFSPRGENSREEKIFTTEDTEKVRLRRPGEPCHHESAVAGEGSVLGGVTTGVSGAKGFPQ